MCSNTVQPTATVHSEKWERGWENNESLWWREGGGVKNLSESSVQFVKATYSSSSLLITKRWIPVPMITIELYAIVFFSLCFCLCHISSKTNLLSERKFNQITYILKCYNAVFLMLSSSNLPNIFTVELDNSGFGNWDPDQ